MNDISATLSSLTAPPRLDTELDALLLDFDGTLVELACEPDAVIVPPNLTDLLRTVSAGLGGALALVTGRPLDFIDDRLGWSMPFAAGVHGLEIRGAPSALLSEQAYQALEQMRSGLSEVDPRLTVEDKGLSISFHFRKRPEMATYAKQLAVAIVAGSANTLVALSGKMVVELKPAAADKGTAVTALMSQHPFAGRRPIFIGDDLTDEAGFAAVECYGGVGVLVGHRSPTRARHLLNSVAATRYWLRQQATAIGASQIT